MASAPERHGPSWRIVWRYQGKKQQPTFATEELALEAKRIVEGFRGNRTRDQVYIDMGILDPEPGPTVPTFEEYAPEWLAAKTGITRAPAPATRVSSRTASSRPSARSRWTRSPPPTSAPCSTSCTTPMKTTSPASRTPRLPGTSP
ncbi:hypothetical protein NKG94_34710 [Micromonospora sp. M12]